MNRITITVTKDGEKIGVFNIDPTERWLSAGSAPAALYKAAVDVAQWFGTGKFEFEVKAERAPDQRSHGGWIQEQGPADQK